MQTLSLIKCPLFQAIIDLTLHGKCKSSHGKTTQGGKSQNVGILTPYK